MQIRDANETDLAGILQIYNDAVEHSTAIWNEQTVDLANRRAWLASHQAAGNAVLVAVDAGAQVLGYASFCAWRTQDGFRQTVEHSVYVRDGQRGNGIGRALLTQLIERARQADMHVLIGAVDSANRDSIHLHQQLGFIHVGQLRQVGRKFDRWLDLTLMQLTLGPRKDRP